MDVVRKWKIDDNRYDKFSLHTKYIIVKYISDKYLNHQAQSGIEWLE